ncbi:hypothetical protein BDAP_001402 [Binucleata daphniae]
MQENQKINEEIRKFLDLNTKDAQNNNQISYYNNYDETCDKSNNFEQLLQTLRELKSCYENDKVKDTAVINNNLTNLIKAIVEERKDKEEEIKAKENILNDFKKQIEEKEKEIVRIKNNVKYDKMKVEEVNRIFKDQKERFTEYKSKYEQQTKTLESLKLINKELEVLREREKEKNEYLEKQMNVFGEFLKEKDTEICSLKKKVSEKEDEIKLMNKKIDEIQESKVKNEKILQEKENIINVLNGEMNVLLGKIKGKKQETEDMKEKASYYERLYKSVSKQNEYLNKELYKMINIKKEDMQNKFTGLNDEKYKYDVNNKECKFDKKDKSADLNGWKYKYDNKNKEYKFDTKNKEYKFDNKNASFSFDSFCIENEQNLNEKLQNLKIDTKNDDFSKKQRNYKKKIKKIKNLYENKKMENERKDDEIKASKNKIYDLANEIKTVRTENEKMGDNYKKITEKLFERIENLIENNKNLQEMVYELKKENIKMDDVKEKNNMDYTYTIKPENDNLRNTNFRNDIFYNYEHGITSKDRLKTVETEKYRKYDLLKKELAMIHKYEVEVIPYVITWDGITTKCHKTYRRKLEIDKHVEAYIQSLTLKKTLESITLDMWSTVDDFRASREEKVCDALKVVYKVDDDAEEGEVKGFD